MWKINWIAIAAVAGIFGTIFIVIFFATGPNSITFRIWLQIILYVVFLIIAVIGGYTLYNYNQKSKRKYLTENGIQGTAMLLSVQPTGIYINRLPRYMMRFRINIPGREPYEITKSKVVNYLSISRLIPGFLFSVLVDPKKPRRVWLKI